MEPNDRLRPASPDRTRIRTRLAAGLPLAAATVLTVAAVALGSSVLRPALEAAHHPDATGQAAASEPAADATDGSTAEPQRTDGIAWSQDPKDEATELPTAEPTPEATPEPTAKAEPTPKPEPKATPRPVESGTIGLTVASADGRVKLVWTQYSGDRFHYYKIVRSTDSTVRWPLGEKDTLVAYTENQEQTKLIDETAPCGTRVWYRVFAVTSGETGYTVLAASPTRGITVEGCTKPTPTPHPDPAGMDLSATQVADGVQLTWSGCDSDAFAAYKVVRSQTDEHPSYPLNDGDQLIGVLSNAATHTFTDPDVAPGQTWHYRVLAMGNDGAWYPVCVTDAVTVSVS
jgi:hypothetical protein